MIDYLPLIIALSIGLTFAAVALVLRADARRGWLPLAAAFPLEINPGGSETTLRWVSVGKGLDGAQKRRCGRCIGRRPEFANAPAGLAWVSATSTSLVGNRTVTE